MLDFDILQVIDFYGRVPTIYPIRDLQQQQSCYRNTLPTEVLVDGQR